MLEEKLITKDFDFGEPEDVTVNRQVKDRVFTMLFSTKEAQLELYNAMNNTHYANVDDLQTTTLLGVVYMGMKNDVSFLLHNHLSLFEQQSTLNPNMPLRQLLYVAEQYKRITKKAWIYGSTLLKLPKPQFIILYNGVKEAPERQFLRLSDAYYKVGDRQNGIFAPDDVSLELVAMVININHGCNDSIKSRSPLLEQYGQFVDMIHQFQREVPIQEATKLAIEYCIQNGILKEFLEKERDAVMSNILYEYDEQETLAYIAEERYGAGVEYGRTEGRTEGELFQLINLVKKKMAKSKTIDVIAEELECNPVEIQEIFDVVEQCGVDSSAEKIMLHLTKG